MKNMKFQLTLRKITSITCIALLFAVFNGCSDEFLDNPPQGFLTNAIFPENAAQAQLAVNGMYADLRQWNLYYGGYPIFDIMSDDARKGSNPGDGAFLFQYDQFTFTPDIGDIANWYTTLYEAIKSTHVVIERVPEIEMDAAIKNRHIAQARFLRALHYSNLVRGFGDVPKVVNLLPDPGLPRSPKSEIYNEIIIPDLIFAAENLPTKNEWPSADLGRATKGAAQALLAKVYLYTEDYPNAELMAMEVINSMQYDLEFEFSNAFLPVGEFGIESVFEVGAVPFGTGATGGNQFANTQSVRGNPNRGWGFNRPSLDLMAAFEDNDPRKDATIIFLNEVLDGVTIIGDLSTPDSTFENGELVEIECYNQKVWVPGSTTEEPFGYNVKEMRYAEVLLIAAEAMNKNGNTGGALIELNKLRQRVGISDITETDPDALHLAIMLERRREMALEQERFFDLVRTGLAPEVLGPYGFVTGKHENFPIPASERALNPNLVQSGGW
jgi:hypothetical protein